MGEKPSSTSVGEKTRSFAESVLVQRRSNSVPTEGRERKPESLVRRLNRMAKPHIGSVCREFLFKTGITISERSSGISLDEKRGPR